jgi:NTE family protein
MTSGKPLIVPRKAATQPKIGLALGSGSARGWAHLGVIRALREAGIEPDVVCGTSAGALVGAAYAGGDLDGFEDWVRTLRWRDVLSFFDFGLNGGLIKGEKLMGFLAEHFVGRTFSDLNKPFACVATDLVTGREIWLQEGDVVAAVRASIALPGLFAPCLRGEQLLVDGALVNPVPVSLCRAMGADIVIAVDLGSDIVRRHWQPRDSGLAPVNTTASEWQKRLRRWLGREPMPDQASEAGENGERMVLPSLLNVVASSINIMQVRIARSRLAGEPADVLITPRLGELGLFDYDRADEAISEGHTAMQLVAPQLHRLLESF